MPLAIGHAGQVQNGTQRSSLAAWAQWLTRHPFFLGAIGSLVAAIGTGVVMAELFPQFVGWPGSLSFARIAAHFAHDGVFASSGPSQTAERMPLYPLVLAALMRLAGSSWRWWSVGLNALALVTCSGLATRLCARLYRSAGTTWTCALLLAFHVGWSIEALALRETAFFALVLMGIASVLTKPRMGPASLALAGGLTGAAYLLRPTGFLVVAILPFWFWAARRSIARAFVRSAVLALLVAAVPVVAWQIYTVRELGHLELSNSEGGNTVLKGAIPEFWIVAPWTDLDLLDPWVTAEAERAGANSPDTRDAFWRTQALAEIRSAPTNWMAKASLKMAMLFSPINVPFGYGRVLPRGNSLRLLDFVWDRWAFVSVPSVILVLCGAATRLWQWRTLSRLEYSFAVPVAVLLTLVCLLHAATSGETRYRLPFDPLLAILAAPIVVQWLLPRGLSQRLSSSIDGR